MFCKNDLASLKMCPCYVEKIFTCVFQFQIERRERFVCPWLASASRSGENFECKSLHLQMKFSPFTIDNFLSWIHQLFVYKMKSYRKLVFSYFLSARANVSHIQTNYCEHIPFEKMARIDFDLWLTNTLLNWWLS